MPGGRRLRRFEHDQVLHDLRDAHLHDTERVSVRMRGGRRLRHGERRDLLHLGVDRRAVALHAWRVHEPVERHVPTHVRVLGRLHGGSFRAALLPRDLRGDLHKGLHAEQRLPPRDLLQVPCTAAAPRPAAIHRAAEVHWHAFGDHLSGLSLSDFVLRLRRVHRLLGSGELHEDSDLLELRLVPIPLLREPELSGVLPGLHCELG